MCWNCEWGVPKPIAEIYQEAVARLDGDDNPLQFGPAHIVWSDFNLERVHVQWCIDNFDKYVWELTEDQQCVVMWSLQELLKLSDDILGYLPEKYIQDENLNADLADYPPDIECVKI